MKRPHGDEPPGERFDHDGIEILIDTATGESFASVSGYARMSGKDKSTISRRLQTVAQNSKKTAEIQTTTGFKTVALIPENLVSQWLMQDNPEAENAILIEENEQLAEALDELFNYSSILRIAKFNGVPETSYSWRTLKIAARKLGLELKRVPCPRFETRLLYPHDAWRLAYPDALLPETTTLRLNPPMD